MRAASQRNPADWFAAAACSYVENHQGCAWCGGSHRVRQLAQGAHTIYYCNFCDFQASFHQETGVYNVVPGENLTPPGAETLSDQKLF